MKYEFRDGIAEEEYRAFLASFGSYSIMQDPSWAAVKTSWQHDLVGLYADGKLVAGALVLRRRLLPGATLLYAPRGFVMDYSDADAVRAFTEGIRRYARRRHAYLVRIDPPIVLSDRHLDTVTENAAGKEQLETLVSLGYRHKGFARDFQSYTQPRYYADILLTKPDGTPMTDAELSSSVSRRARKLMGTHASEKGIFFEARTGSDAAKEFADVIRHTEQRKGILLRDEAYFERVSQAFGDRCEFVFGKMDLTRFLSWVDTRENTENNEADRAAAEDLRQRYGDVVTMCATLCVSVSDTANLLYGGFNDEVFPRYSGAVAMRFDLMKHCRDRGLKWMSLMGIHGDLQDSLSEFKLKFNPHIVEYAGEFDLPCNRLVYGVMDRLFPVAKRVFLRLSRKKRAKETSVQNR